MRRKRRTTRVVGAALMVAAFAALSLASSASAKLTGEYTKFQQCPWTNAETFKCVHALTESGEIVLGKKTVKVENPVLLQGGFTKPVEKISKFIAATNGQTLAKVKQNVPGGLLGIVPPESSPWLVKRLSAFFFENSLTGVTSTLELAKSASDIRMSESNLSTRIGVALEMPVKVHLENPFLGSNCFVGSSSSPIMWKLTSGITTPPGPNTSIEGASGKIEFLEGGRILRLNGNKIVDNAWSAPSASGCGGLISFLVNPIINTQVGLPSAAGKNTAILNNTISLSTAAAVKKNNEDNP
jgi:hypothetical protein